MLQEIRVRFNPSADDRFRVQFTDAAGIAQGVECEFTPFLAEGDYENLRWYLEEYLDLPDGGAVTRAAGIEQVWMQQGAESSAAIQFCQENGISEVHGECILMFACGRSFPHNMHRWVWGALGKLPK